MMPLDLPPAQKLWTPPKPAIIRSGLDLLRVNAPADMRMGTFPFPVFCPAAGGITAIVQQASATSTATTITWPTVAAGDIAVLFDVVSGAVTPTAVTPTGFTNMCNASGLSPAESSQYRIMTSFKRCTGTESGSLTGMATPGGGLVRKAMVTFRSTPASATATGGDGENGAVTDGNPSAITVNASAGAAPLIVVGCYATSTPVGSINPRTFTVGGSDAKDGELSFHSNRIYIAWKFYLSSPADVVIDMDDEGNANCVQGFYCALT